MKKLVVLITAFMAIASCSSPTEKVINPSSNQFISGKLSEYVQNSNAPVTISCLEDELDPGTFTVSMAVTLEIKKDRLKRVNSGLVDFEDSSLLSINLVDANGAVLTELNIFDDYKQVLAGLLTEEGFDSLDLIFTNAFSKSEAKSIFNQTVGFTPNKTSDIKPIKLGVKLTTAWKKFGWYSKEKYVLKLMNDGVAKSIKYIGGDSGDNYKCDLQGSWVTDSYRVGNNREKYYEVAISNDDLPSYVLYIPAKFNYAFENWGDMSSNATHSAFKIVSVEDINMKNI